MNSSDSEGSLSPSLPIPKLIKFIKHSFLEREFNAVQNILVNREQNMKIEIESLSRDRDSVREEISLLKENVSLGELKYLKLEDELVKVQRKCDELEETVSRLLEEKWVAADREKRAEQVIVELNEKVDKLTKKNCECERLAGVYRDKYNRLATKTVKMGQEIDDLRHVRLASSGTIEDLWRKLSEAEKAGDELKRHNIEANGMVDEMRLKKLKLEKEAEYNRRMLESLATRITEIEEKLAGMLNVNVENLADLVGDGNLAQFLERNGFVHTVEASPVSRSGYDSPLAENNECELPPGSGAHYHRMPRPMSMKGHFRKFTTSPTASGGILEITANDGGTGPRLEIPVSSRGLSENEMTCEDKSVHSPSSSSLKTNRIRRERGWDVVKNSSKRTRSSCTVVDTQSPLGIYNGSTDDGDSTNSDESCSDSRIDELVAGLGAYKHFRKLNAE